MVDYGQQKFNKIFLDYKISVIITCEKISQHFSYKQHKSDKMNSNKKRKTYWNRLFSRVFGTFLFAVILL